MKLSDGFDARRLRPSGPGGLRWRLGAVLAALLTCLGVLLTLAGTAALLGRPTALGPLNDSIGAALTLLLGGLLLLWLGVFFWRRCRRHLRQRYSSELSLSPRLLKKRG